MHGRRWATGVLAGLALIAGTGTTQAQTVFRLNLTTTPTPAATRSAADDVMTLQLNNKDADTLQVWGWRGGYYRPYYGGYYPRYYGGFSYYPRYYGSYYGGFSYYPRYYSYYQPYYYGFSYYPYWGCSLTIEAGEEPPQVAAATPLQPNTPLRPNLPQTQPSAPAAPRNDSGTFQYDGGPSNPVPLPSTTTPRPNTEPRPTVPLEGRTVSLPTAKPKYTYAAYGEEQGRPTTAPKSDRAVVIRR